MKSIITTLAILTCTVCYGQSFEWNKKGADAGAGEPTALAAYESAYNNRQVGLAAEYAPGFAGKKTVYGELYRPDLLTASHSILPLGTLVRVTNLANDATVVVRINDRTQDCQDCLITLSDAAAKALSLNIRARVSVERTGFSNWNPNHEGHLADAPKPANYGSGTKLSTAQRSTTAPISIEGEAYGWTGKEVEPSSADEPAAPTRVVPTVYNRSASPASQPGATASVLDREVVAANNPSVRQTAEPSTGVVNPRPAPTTYASTSSAQNGVPQAAPPSPTVPYYQEGRTIPAPANYPTPTGARVTPVGAPVAAPAAMTTTAPSTTVSASSQSGNVVQLGAYSNEAYAQKRVVEFQTMGIANSFYRTFPKPDGSVIHRVYSGSFASRAEAQKAADYIRDVHQVAGVVTEIR